MKVTLIVVVYLAVGALLAGGNAADRYNDCGQKSTVLDVAVDAVAWGIVVPAAIIAKNYGYPMRMC
jgi:hypothetical protein